MSTMTLVQGFRLQAPVRLPGVPGIRGIRGIRGTPGLQDSRTPGPQPYRASGSLRLSDFVWALHRAYGSPSDDAVTLYGTFFSIARRRRTGVAGACVGIGARRLLRLQGRYCTSMYDAGRRPSTSVPGHRPASRRGRATVRRGARTRRGGGAGWYARVLVTSSLEERPRRGQNAHDIVHLTSYVVLCKALIVIPDRRGRFRCSV